jgi:quinol monooxygenase YgiN
MEKKEVQIAIEYAVSPGKVDAFKKLAQEATDVVKATEPNMIGYRWYFNNDDSRCYLLEQLPDSASTLSHLANANVAPILPKLHEISKITRFEVFGNLNPEAEKALAGYGPKNFRYWNGFVRKAAI